MGNPGYMRYSMGPLVALLLAFNFVPMLGLVIWLPVSLLTWLFTGRRSF